MTYWIRIDSNGTLTEFLGNDDELVNQGSFVLDRANGSHAVAQLIGPGEWVVHRWLPEPHEPDVTPDTARLGREIGCVRQNDTGQWEGFEIGARHELSTKPGPGGPGTIGWATESLCGYASIWDDERPGR